MDEQSALLPHEPSRVSLGAIASGIGIMVGGVALAVLGALAESHFAPSPRSAPNNAGRPRIAGAVLRTAAPLDLEAFLREKEARLHGRGIDRATHEPYVPIEEAMRAMAGEPAKGSGR
jgi:hypothetical protein